MARTTRWRIPTPELTDNADVPEDMRALADALDDHKKTYQGLRAAMPAAGVIGREYFATDDRTAGDNGTLYQDNGTTWIAIGSVQNASIDRVKLADNAVERRHLADASVGLAEMYPDVIPIASGGGAATNALALRAIGAGSNNVVAGNDTRLTDTRTPTDNTVTPDKLSSALAANVGVTQTGTVRRGYVEIAGEESRTNTVFGLLATPDRVQSVVLPRGGLIFVIYQATWRGTTAGGARAAIFIGANQAVIQQGGAGPEVTETVTGKMANTYASLITTPIGLVGTGLNSSSDNVSYTGDVTTGQLVGWDAPSTLDDLQGGGPACIFAAAGTYDVSVQFRSTGGGTVAARNRRLWVWTQAF